MNTPACKRGYEGKCQPLLMPRYSMPRCGHVIADQADFPFRKTDFWYKNLYQNMPLNI